MPECWSVKLTTFEIRRYAPYEGGRGTVVRENSKTILLPGSSSWFGRLALIVQEDGTSRVPETWTCRRLLPGRTTEISGWIADKACVTGRAPPAASYLSGCPGVHEKRPNLYRCCVCAVEPTRILLCAEEKSGAPFCMLRNVNLDGCFDDARKLIELMLLTCGWMRSGSVCIPSLCLRMDF